MAQYGGEQQSYGHKEGHHTDEHVHNPLQSTGAVGAHDIEATKFGTIGSTTGATAHVHDQPAGKHNAGGILHRSGSGSSSSSEDDGEGGRRKKKGVVEKLPGGGADDDQHKTSATTTTTVGGGTGGGYDHQVEEGHDEKKGLMDKIKEKLPGGHK